MRQSDRGGRVARTGRGTGALRNALGTAVALLLAVVASVLVVPTAEASVGCTPIGNYRVKGMSPNTVCMIAEGKGLRVDHAQVNFGAPAGGLQNVVLRITFFDVNNHQVAQYLSQLHKGTRLKEEYDIYPKKEFPTGRVCGSITENGVERPGACLGLHP